MASPIAFLAGTWRGAGAGEFPTMESFAYEEEISFLDLGVPALVYQQRAWLPDDGSLLHLETGIWRATPEGRLAVTVALPRVTEVSEGAIADGTITLVASSVRRAEGGAGLVAVERIYHCTNDEIRYEIGMATDGVPAMTHHLSGVLRRSPVDQSSVK